MRTFDPTPFWRSTVGFDRLFDMLDQIGPLQANDTYPPYNIERAGEDHYRISLALAGFSPDEVTITAEQNVLTVEGSKAQKPETEYLYQGISARPFRRVFNLADYVQVKSASFEDGLLKIDLVREVPEAMKPRRIAINGGATKPTIEQKKAAKRLSTAARPRPLRPREWHLAGGVGKCVLPRLKSGGRRSSEALSVRQLWPRTISYGLAATRDLASGMCGSAEQECQSI